MHGSHRVPGSLPVMSAKMIKPAAFKVAIECSPRLPGTRPIELRYQVGGRGAPIVLLHGGWGYGFYPHDAAIGKLDRRVVIADGAAYGGAPPTTESAAKCHVAGATRAE